MDTLITLGSRLGLRLQRVGHVLFRTRRSVYFDTASVIVTLILIGQDNRSTRHGHRRVMPLARCSIVERKRPFCSSTKRGWQVPDRRSLRPDQLVVVRPGRRSAADGVVREGSSWIDLSLLTGESVPVDVAPGDDVVGASAENGHATWSCVVTKRVGANTKLAEIVRLLERGQGSKAPVPCLAGAGCRRSSSPSIIHSRRPVRSPAGTRRTPQHPGSALLHAVLGTADRLPVRARARRSRRDLMSGGGRAAELGIFTGAARVFQVPFAST